MNNRHELYSNSFVRKTINKATGEKVVTIEPGGYYVTRDGELMTTVLGSCIAVCIYDKTSFVAGINHFLLPEIGSTEIEKGANKTDESAMRYGDWAMEELINVMLQKGAKKERLVFKVFGGSSFFESKFDIGQRNIQFVFAFLNEEKYEVKSKDVGGNVARRVNFYTHTGEVKIKKIGSNSEALGYTKKESNYIKAVQNYDKNDEGKVDFFD